MKTFIKSAFFLNLIIVIMFGTLMTLSYYANLQDDSHTAPTMFFGVVTLVYLMILPACSTKK